MAIPGDPNTKALHHVTAQTEESYRDFQSNTLIYINLYLEDLRAAFKISYTKQKEFLPHVLHDACAQKNIGTTCATHPKCDHFQSGSIEVDTLE